MSYRNPQQFVDTQSAQHVARMQQQITGAFVDYAKSYAAKNAGKRKEIQEYKKGLSKSYEAAVTSTEKLSGQYPSLDLSNIDAQLDLNAQLLLKDPSDLTSEDRNFMRHMKNMPEGVRDLITTIESGRDSYVKAFQKMGVEGGFAADELTMQDRAKNILMRIDGAKGRMELNMDMKGDRSTMGVDVYVPIMKDGEMTEEKVTLYPGDFEEHLDGTKIATVTKDITDPFVNDFVAKSKTIDFWKQGNGKRKSFTVNGKTTTYFVPDQEKLKKDIKANVAAGVGAYSDKELVAYHNNILTSNPKESIDYSKELTTDQKNVIVDKITDNLMKNPNFNKQYIADKTSDDGSSTQEFDSKQLSQQEQVAYEFSRLNDVKEGNYRMLENTAVKFGSNKGTITEIETGAGQGDVPTKLTLKVASGSGQTLAYDSINIDLSNKNDVVKLGKALVRGGYSSNVDEKVMSLIKMITGKSYDNSDFDGDVFVPGK